MSEKLEPSRKFIFIGIIIIALGIIFSETLKDTADSLGTVLISVGGLFFIIGISKKREEDELKNE